MNNDNDLNLHSMTKLSGWRRYCARPKKSCNRLSTPKTKGVSSTMEIFIGIVYQTKQRMRIELHFYI